LQKVLLSLDQNVALLKNGINAEKFLFKVKKLIDLNPIAFSSISSVTNKIFLLAFLKVVTKYVT